MKNIQLTDKEARITKIETEEDITTVTLEWSGPNDRTIDDFATDHLGTVISTGGNLCGGWAVLSSACNLTVGVVIPLEAAE